MNWTKKAAEQAQAKVKMLAAFSKAGANAAKRTETPHTERTPKETTNTKPSTAKERTQALGRIEKGKMNATEKKYAQHLDALKFAGEIMDYWFEEIKFKIGTSACWYEPDFLVQVKGGAMEIHEVKGGGGFQDDALVKTKALALRYPFRVISATLVKGDWEIREFN